MATLSQGLRIRPSGAITTVKRILPMTFLSFQEPAEQDSRLIRQILFSSNGLKAGMREQAPLLLSGKHKIFILTSLIDLLFGHC